MNRTPLYEEHLALGARLVPFAGWEMPIQYTSIIEEHMTVRSSCGVFDVSHMGDLIIRGEGARTTVSALMTNDLAKAPPGKCIYSHLLDEHGMILDDTIVTLLGEEEVFMVPNAATTDRILAWVTGHAGRLEVVNQSRQIATIAVQGPSSEEVLQKLTSADLSSVGSFRAAFASLDRVGESMEASTELLADRPLANPGAHGVPALLSRTGYTGEDGFEVMVENDAAISVWRALFDAGDGVGTKPAGLGARDTLRLEKGLLLSGTDFDGAQTSLQTGPSWVVKWDHEFIGRPALERQKESGGYPVLAGMMLRDKGIPRTGYEIVSEGRRVGTVTSGTLSPVMRKGIALGYLPAGLAEPGSRVNIRIRDSLVDADTVQTPFVKREQK